MKILRIITRKNPSDYCLRKSKISACKNLPILGSRFLFVSEYSQVFKAETTSKPVRIFRVVLLFSYQRTFHRCVSDLISISCLFCFVKNFFTFLKSCFQSPWLDFSKLLFSVAAKFILPLCKWIVKNFFN